MPTIHPTREAAIKHEILDRLPESKHDEYDIEGFADKNVYPAVDANRNQGWAVDVRDADHVRKLLEPFHVDSEEAQFKRLGVDADNYEAQRFLRDYCSEDLWDLDPDDKMVWIALEEHPNPIRWGS